MKWLGGIGKLVAVVILASCISVGTAFVVVQLYVEQLLKPYAAMLPHENVDFSTFLVKLWSDAHITKQEGASSTGQMDEEQPVTTTEQGGAHTPPQQPAQPQSGGQATLPGQSDAKETVAGQDDAVAVWSQQGGMAADQMVLTDKQFLAARDQMSEEDKATIFTLLIPNLTPEALQTISTIVEGGITAEELAQIESIVADALPAEQFDTLLKLVQKYEILP